jgi:5-methylcytosine-specific restriction endonuclease McrA
MKNKHLYPADWNDTIRPAILKRDNYRCKKCFVKHREVGYFDRVKNFIPCDSYMQTWASNNGFKVQTLFLQIAHLNHDKSDCRPENLEALCPRCHLNYDREYNNMLRKMQGRQKQKKF